MKLIKLIFVLIAVAAVVYLVANDQNSSQNSYKDIDAYQARKMIDRYQNLVVVDISGTYEMGHIPGSVNYFIGDGSLETALEELDKNKRYLVYYHNNKTSKLAAEMFANAGFRKVYRLDGNYSSWVEAGYETAALAR